MRRRGEPAVHAGGLFHNLIFERYAFRVVFLQPGFRGVLAGKNLKVILVSNLLAGIDVDPDSHG
jgi:hypothetical protein